MISENINQLKDTESYNRILLAFTQPLTAKQVSKKIGIPVNTCSYVIAKYVQKGIFTCLNPKARNSRLYWLTNAGILCQKELCRKLNIACIKPNLPDIDWELYGWICFSHRAMVIKALTSAMQPSEVKRVLRLQKANTRISYSNIRDVVRLLLSKSIVRPVRVKREANLQYELTESGIKLQQLLLRADAVL